MLAVGMCTYLWQEIQDYHDSLCLSLNPGLSVDKPALSSVNPHLSLDNPSLSRDNSGLSVINQVHMLKNSIVKNDFVHPVISVLL